MSYTGIGVPYCKMWDNINECLIQVLEFQKEYKEIEAETYVKK